MSEQQLELKLASQLSKLMEEDDDEQNQPFLAQSGSRDYEKPQLKHQRSILDDFANGFMPEEILNRDMDDDHFRSDELKEKIGADAKNNEGSQSNKAKSQSHKSVDIDESFKDFQSELDQLGQLDVDQLDNILTLADNLAIQLAYKTSAKMNNIKSKVQSQIDAEKKKITAQFLKRKRILEQYMNKAPIVRFMDKIFFIVGVLLLIATTYMLGRYPNKHYYTFHIYTVTTLVVIRLFNYRIKRWHYYLFDFCYFANTLIIYYLVIDPKNDILFRIFFVYANGPFGLAIPAFKNSMIFHKLDNLTSIAIHLIPLVTSYNLRWTTLFYERSLPEGERYFLNIDEDNEKFTLNFLFKMFFIPFAVYILWAFLYYMKVFIISSKKIKERNYETMYIYYYNQAWAKKILDKAGPQFGPIVFMSFHVGFFILSSGFAIIAFNSFWVHTILTLIWTIMSIWNGANFYMEYFSRKYEANLKMLGQIEQQLTLDAKQEATESNKQ
ncbi:UNKNOWN [Stylonychia lemnae]|uniref:Glycerophosphocholine acyltransferase 1 n=1 Tax=Stylonychia lemnae TaxID=5949 RepID=A0A078AAY1_STYLE|nr:UNKNOWN [Stylonychia lemnae]|eukprot:CDW79016.1 UNKNOWN [Stylonychia lemnae]